MSAALFYASLIAGAAGLLLLVRFTRLRTIPGLAAAIRTLLLLTILLPVADYVFERSHRDVAPAKPATPVYSFTAANGDPAAFKLWWEYYAGEWFRPNGGKASTEMPDPKGILPFVFIPNSVGPFFDAVVRINNFGFRGADIEFDKGNRYRIFALGESPTFGATIRRDDLPWPDVLGKLIQSRLQCDRPIEVINAGTEAYNLQNNLERVRRDIIPLKPDLVLSYHGFNGARFVDVDPVEGAAPAAPSKDQGPSALVNELVYRIKLFRWRKSSVTVPTFSQETILHSRYAELYRELIGLGRDNDFLIVLANFSMVVVPSSPREVVEFYQRAFVGIDQTMARMAAHNDIVEKLAAEANVPFIDTTPNLAGEWDEDLFLDPVHFTQKGSNRLAETMLSGLLPILRGNESLRCRERAISR